MSKQVAVTVRILDKEFQIGCPPEERAALEASVTYLNDQMKEVKNSGVIGTDKIAILAALNISRELLQYRNSASDRHHLSEGLEQLSEHINATLRQLNT